VSSQPLTPGELLVCYGVFLVAVAVVRAMLRRGSFAHGLLGAFLWLNGLVVRIAFKLVGAVLIGIVGGLVYHSVRHGGLFTPFPSHPPYQSQHAPTLRHRDG
jgi:hypothetical protein